MAFDFPNAPSLGQTVTLGGNVYQWNGEAWNRQSGNVGPTGPQGPVGPAGPAGADGAPGPTGGVTIEVGDAAPPTPADKSLWFEADSGALWLRYPDPTGEKHWLQVNASLILPPQDGAEYVMRNGIWRKKCETFTWTTQKVAQVVLCPPGATKVTARIFVSNATPQATGSLGFQASQDGGATWLLASGSYYASGLYADGSGTGNSAIAAYTFGYLGWSTNNTSVGNHCTADIQLVRPVTGGSTMTWHAVGGGYFDTAPYTQRTWVVNGYMSAGFDAAKPINAIQFFNANSQMYAGSIECTWGYG